MNSIFRNFRLWWQPPSNIRDRPEHRQVAFLELFYDLVYVVVISELTNALSNHIDLKHVAEFVFLFLLVWWAWLNGSAYHELHGNNDVRTRVFTFLQMGTVAGMAVFVHNAVGDGAVGFALSVAGFQLILTYLWWRTGVHDPNHRPLSRPYTAAFLFNTLLFLVSAFVESPLRFYIWGLALVTNLTLPIYTFFLIGRDDPEVQDQIELSTMASPSFVERFGLFTIIVLGEVLVGVVQGVANQQSLTFQVGAIAAMGMGIAVAYWWLYFDLISHRLPLPGTAIYAVWVYLHLPVTIGIAATGATVLNVVEHSGEDLPSNVRWLLVAAIAVVLVSIAALVQTIQKPEVHLAAFRRAWITLLVSAILIAALGASGLETVPLLVALVLLMLAPVVVGLISWIKMLTY